MAVLSTHTTADAAHKGEVTSEEGQEVAQGQDPGQGPGPGDLVLVQAAEVVPGPGVGTADQIPRPSPSPGAEAGAKAVAGARVQKRNTTAVKAEVNRHREHGLRPRVKAEVAPRIRQERAMGR